MRKMLLIIAYAAVSVTLVSCSKEKKEEDKVPEKIKQEELKDTTRLDSAKTDDQ